MGECDVDMRQRTNIAVGISVIESECVRACVRACLVNSLLRSREHDGPFHSQTLYGVLLGFLKGERG